MEIDGSNEKKENYGKLWKLMAIYRKYCNLWKFMGDNKHVWKFMEVYGRKLLFPISFQLKGTRLPQENACCLRLTTIIRSGLYMYTYV